MRPIVSITEQGGRAGAKLKWFWGVRFLISSVYMPIITTRIQPRSELWCHHYYLSILFHGTIIIHASHFNTPVTCCNIHYFCADAQPLLLKYLLNTQLLTHISVLPQCHWVLPNLIIHHTYRVSQLGTPQSLSLLHTPCVSSFISASHLHLLSPPPFLIFIY